MTCKVTNSVFDRLIPVVLSSDVCSNGLIEGAIYIVIYILRIVVVCRDIENAGFVTVAPLLHSFYCMMLCRARLCNGKTSVRPSVCLLRWYTLIEYTVSQINMPLDFCS